MHFSCVGAGLTCIRCQSSVRQPLSFCTALCPPMQTLSPGALAPVLFGLIYPLMFLPSIASFLCPQFHASWLKWAVPPTSDASYTALPVAPSAADMTASAPGVQLAARDVEEEGRQGSNKGAGKPNKEEFFSTKGLWAAFVVVLGYVLASAALIKQTTDEVGLHRDCLCV